MTRNIDCGTFGGIMDIDPNFAVQPPRLAKADFEQAAIKESEALLKPMTDAELRRLEAAGKKDEQAEPTVTPLTDDEVAIELARVNAELKAAGYIEGRRRRPHLNRAE
jgi:hypothetical protein